MKLIDRLKAPTPKFFKILRNVGLGLAAAGGVIIASPIAIPTLIVTIGGYLIVAGSVATAISQAVTTTEGDATTVKNN
jgi:ABC-type xylose transport system permease subunit